VPPQVEHGITEMVHGNVDIVEWQLRLQVPGLERLDLTREMPVTSGCAIEVRLLPPAGLANDLQFYNPPCRLAATPVGLRASCCLAASHDRARPALPPLPGAH
jgi:hypothetical protein